MKNFKNIAQSSHLNIFSQKNYAEFIGLITLKAQINAYHDVFFLGDAFLLLTAFTLLLIKVSKGKKLEKVLID